MQVERGIVCDMIIQNRFGNVILRVASFIGRGGHYRGFSPYPYLIFIHTDIDLESKTGKCLLVHERTHTKQQIRMYLVGFYAKYLYDWVRNGCHYSRDLPLEKAAYAAQNKCLNDIRIL